jgi:hypothetical protein
VGDLLLLTVFLIARTFLSVYLATVNGRIVQFGALRGRLGMNGKAEVGERVRRFNMKKYANRLYL